MAGDIPTPVIPEEIASGSGAWALTTFAQQAPPAQAPSGTSGAVSGPNVVITWQDTATTPNRRFRLQDTGNGFNLDTSSDGVTWVNVTKVTDVTQATIFQVLTNLTLDQRSMAAPGALGAAPFAHRVLVGTEANPRFTVGTAGDMSWGAGGASATDVFLSRVSAAVLIVTGVLRMSGAPSGATDVTTKNYVDTQDALRLLLSGGTMTGALILNADPTNVLGAATKQYVDNKINAVAGISVATEVTGVSTSNTAVETTIISFTILANKLNGGSIVEILTYPRFNNASGVAVTYTVRLYMDATILVSEAVSVATGINLVNEVLGRYVIENIGVGGTFSSTYKRETDSVNATATPPVSPGTDTITYAAHLVDQTIDTTAAHTIKLTVQMSVANVNALVINEAGQVVVRF